MSLFCDPQTIIKNLIICDIGLAQILEMQSYQKAKKLVQKRNNNFVR